MDWRAKVGLALGALLVVVQVVVTATDVESWPLSSFPMFARSPTSGERVRFEVRAFTSDGARIKRWRPHSKMNTWRGFLKKTWRGPPAVREARVQRFLDAMVAHQDARVVRADLIELTVEGAPKSIDRVVKRRVIARWPKRVRR